MLAGIDPAAVDVMLTQLGLARENLKQAIADKTRATTRR